MSNIYAKLSNVQTQLMGETFQTRKGYHGSYIPLEEMLPKIKKACNKEGIVYYFTSTNDSLILKIFDIETGKELSPAPRVRLPEIGKDEKKEGINITYFTRYLLKTTFCIIEEGVDLDDLPDDASSAQTKENKSKSSNNKSSDNKFNPETIWEQAKPKAMEEKGLSEKELTNRSIYAYIARNMGLSQEQKEEMFHYYKNLSEVVA